MLNEYDEHHLKIWAKGGLEPVILTPLGYSEAITLRSKLYRLRKKLQRDNHEVFAVAKLATIKLYPTADASGRQVFNLMVHPSTMGYEQALLNAGITTKSDDPPPLD